MAFINVDQILENEDADAALVALKFCQKYAKEGRVVELIDLLAPEGKRVYTATDSKTGRTRQLSN